MAISIPGSRAPRTYHVFNGPTTPGSAAAAPGSSASAGVGAGEVFVVLQDPDPDDEPYARLGSRRNSNAMAGSHGALGGSSVPRSLLGQWL